jgi:hypothetical protein
MKNLNFTQHTGNECPVYSGLYVVYKTKSHDKDKKTGKPLPDVTHVPMRAGDLCWGDRIYIGGEWHDVVLGKITEYAVVGRVNLPSYLGHKKSGAGRTVNNGSRICN